MTDISKDQVRHVAHLARLAVSEEEVDRMTKQLGDIIHYAELLNELDTTGVEPTTHVLDLKNVMRKDEPRKWITREDALKNAPDQKDGQFKVPTILE
ncbi:aspartyl/glutamyl-tRNA(Asn/Gln) amidotransferase subunit C [Halolactibacillus miurensis]|uniref:Aspartyl/glutamyl-tRNA(Asn/Gln) amidotransferase subunit C n=1 Tax=Halolactibacillus miurensis TaxID=306541 RepID=A0A1I6U5K2_9BACI|nr:MULTISPECIES: Asp-tRNA(Asn)/Glu-tRNA(Gln) amidotransferase subunit GatC [Halolactibacillus]GEM05088.1 aspartyl/glutamyl-tRNA(Asn/Gln) amidotransferase subunit C [Halolactibacillus miurensis]SFS96638.1 aspartyl-tRNA(Asn)/glutamyl-tRNA(Gln) amidotransferase subunit C [Halolactibacillus miurensis]